MSKRILIANFYLEGREQAARTGDYPRSHLWGMDGLTAAGYEVRLLSHRPVRPLLDRISKWSRNIFGNLAEDRELRLQSKDCDAIYIITGHYPLLRRARVAGRVHCPIFSWVYNPPSPRPRRRMERLLPALQREAGMDGYLCLTRAAEAYYRKYHPEIKSRFVTWGADLDMFSPGNVNMPPAALACGRSERDFTTLLKAAADFPIPLDLVAPRSVIGNRSLPLQVRFAGGPEHSATDRGLNYRELIQLQRRAFCHIISLNESPYSAAGYTNLLESLAVGRPVLMTRTGCLDIDIEAEGVGLWTRPRDPASLVAAVRRLVENPQMANEMGLRARRLAEKRFNLRLLDENVASYFREVIGNPEGSRV